MVKITIDVEECTGCGLCVDICPEVFEMKDDKAIVKTTDVSDDVLEEAKDAQESCPAEAITIEE
ncbi:ferredoxin [bacterium]|nr:ferredoxin [bacterium]